MTLLAALLALLAAGSLVYCLLVIEAARRFLRKTGPQDVRRRVGISVLKPLRGLDEGLAENLRSFLAQDYGEFEVLFGVDEADDPALAVAEAVRREFPKVQSRCLVTGRSDYRNPKVYSLERLAEAARYDLLVMSDSDIRVTRDMLATLAAEFENSKLGLVTCPYRAVPGRSFWSTLEAIGMNTEFIPGVLVARMLEGMKFAVGPTIVMRRQVLEAIGGMQRVQDYYIDDFLLGKFAFEKGFGVDLSSYVIDHRIGSQRFWPNVRHRVMWLRGTRRSRPKGYIGQIFTYPLPLALLLLAVQPAWWPLPVASIALRAISAWAVAGAVLHDPLIKRRWWLLPLQDLVSWIFWVAGLFGNTIIWRGRRMALLRDGRFQPLEGGHAG